MEKLLHVTYGYFRFAMLSMLGATSVFFLSSLAVSDVRIFAVVLVLLVLGYFAVRDEVRRKHKAKALTRRLKENPALSSEAIAEWFAFAQATNLLIAAPALPESFRASAFCIVEWRYD